VLIGRAGWNPADFMDLVESVRDVVSPKVPA